MYIHLFNVAGKAKEQVTTSYMTLFIHYPAAIAILLILTFMLRKRGESCNW